MGSLVPGWESTQGLERRGSFTKDEIEAFWAKRKAQEELQHALMEEHLRGLTEEGSGQEQKAGVGAVASTPAPFSASDPDDLTEEEKKARVKDWWRRSNSAYLNNPPESDRDVLKATYHAQFDVASAGSQAEEPISSSRRTEVAAVLQAAHPSLAPCSHHVVRAGNCA